MKPLGGSCLQLGAGLISLGFVKIPEIGAIEYNSIIPITNKFIHPLKELWILTTLAMDFMYHHNSKLRLSEKENSSLNSFRKYLQLQHTITLTKPCLL